MAESANEVVQVTITKDTATPTEETFNTPAFGAYHTLYADRVREYEQLSDAVADGHVAGTPAYQWLQSVFSQNPRPSVAKIIRLTTSVIQSLDFNVIDTTSQDVIGFDLMDLTGTVHQVRVTIPPSSSGHAVALLLKAAVDALALTVTTAVGGSATDMTMVAQVAGQKFHIANMMGLDVTDNTPSANVPNDLTAAQVIDDDWYGVNHQYEDATNIAAVAAWCESQLKIHISQGCDAADINANNTGVTNTLHAAAYTRTAHLWTRSVASYANGAWMGDVFPLDPGSETWAFKTLAGVTVDTLTATQRSNLEAKAGNYYTQVAGINITREGTVASGEYIDVTRFLDWTSARIAEDVYGAIVAAPKLPLTDRGISVLGGKVSAVLAAGVTVGGWVPGSTSVTLPKASSISGADKAARNVPGIKFAGELAGAIHKAQVQGVVTL